MLPDSPRVDFLRREAKDLLAALRESESSTTLAQAQQALAHDFGAANWTELRADVERRREQPPAPDPELGRAVAAAFGLGAPQRMAPISYNFMGRAWSLETTRGRFVMSPVFPYIDDAQAAIGVDLLERARPHGVRSPRPVRDPEGCLVRRIDEQNWRVDEWLDMGPTPMQPVRVAVARRAGEILAIVHAAGGATDRPIPQYLASRHGRASWDALQERAEAAGRYVDALAALRPSIDALLEVEFDPAAAGNRVLSLCDLSLGAVRYGPGDDLVVVHSAFTSGMVPALELGYVLTHWALFGRVNPLAAVAVLDGYRDRAGDLPPLDLASFALGIGGYINWTYNAVCEALLAEGTEKTDFAELSVREVLDDPLTVDKLEQLLESVNAVP
jgi:hypothetical protein